MLAKFEENCMVPIARNFELFEKKKRVFYHFWQRVDASLEDISLAEIVV